MRNLNNLKKVCGFYVSSMHLITMLLPYIKKQIEGKKEFQTFFEYNLKENANNVLQNLVINTEEKKQILNINWKNTRIQKYSNVEKILKKYLDNKSEIDLLISGSKKYINEINNIINKFLEKHFNKIHDKNFTIINCYEVTEFDDNIREILDNHEFILNTSGLHKIDELFEDYKKKVAN